MQSQHDDLIYISFPLDDGSFENLFGRPVSNGIYVLDNSPFYAFGVSLGDEVRASLVDDRMMFERVERHRGHSTYRVKLDISKTNEDFLAMFRPLAALGCTFEGSSIGQRLLYSIDVPPETDVVTVYQYLIDGEADGQWEFEEGHYFT